MTPPSVCPTCSCTQRWPRPRVLNDDATLRIYCSDDFHSPEADEQVGGDERAELLDALVARTRAIDPDAPDTAAIVNGIRRLDSLARSEATTLRAERDNWKACFDVASEGKTRLAKMYTAAEKRAEEAEADAHREHEQVERWSLRAESAEAELERACDCRWAGNTTGEEGPQHECPYHRDHRTSAEAEVARLREALEREASACEESVANSRSRRHERNRERTEAAKKEGWEFGEPLPPKSRRADIYDAWQAGYSLANGATAERLRAALGENP